MACHPPLLALLMGRYSPLVLSAVVLRRACHLPSSALLLTFLAPLSSSAVILVPRAPLVLSAVILLSVPPSAPRAPHVSILPHVLSAVVLRRACHLSSSPLSSPSRSSSRSSRSSRPLCGYTSESLPPSAPRAPHGSILPHSFFLRLYCGDPAPSLATLTPLALFLTFLVPLSSSLRLYC